MKNKPSTAVQKAREKWPETSGDDESEASWSANVSFQEAQELFGEAFLYEPFSKWMLDPLELDDDEKTRAIACLQGFFMYTTLRYGHGTILGFRDSNGKLVAATMIQEYKHACPKPNLWTKLTSTWQNLRAYLYARKSGSLKGTFLVEKSQREQFKRFNAHSRGLVNKMQMWHAKHGPDGPHWYICIVGVASASQGQGYGSKMMRHLHNVLGEAHPTMPCYLETCGDSLPKFYKSLGYEVAGTEALEDPVDRDRKPLDVTFLIRPHAS